MGHIVKLIAPQFVKPYVKTICYIKSKGYRFMHKASAQNSRMGDRQASLSYHLDQVAVGKLVAQVAAHAQDDDLLLEVSAPEQVGLARTVTHARQRFESPRVF